MERTKEYIRLYEALAQKNAELKAAQEAYRKELQTLFQSRYNDLEFLHELATEVGKVDSTISRRIHQRIIQLENERNP